MIIKNFDDAVNNAKVDQSVNIAIGQLTHDGPFCVYGTRMEAGSKVGCHYHKDGCEIYHILSGEGEMHIADMASDDKPVGHRFFAIKKGDAFSIPEKTAHQLKATTSLDLLFFCPPSHLSEDRYMVDDLV